MLRMIYTYISRPFTPKNIKSISHGFQTNSGIDQNGQ